MALSAAAQLGPRTIGNSTTGNLDLTKLSGRLALSSADAAVKKRSVIRDLEYADPAEWQATSFTWLMFTPQGEGEVLISQRGAAPILGIRPSGKQWEVEPVSAGVWKARSLKGSAGKMDLYLDVEDEGRPFEVGAVVPKAGEETFGAVYRGVDFLFFVVQKKPPAKHAG